MTGPPFDPRRGVPAVPLPDASEAPITGAFSMPGSAGSAAVTPGEDPTGGQIAAHVAALLAQEAQHPPLGGQDVDPATGLPLDHPHSIALAAGAADGAGGAEQPPPPSAVDGAATSDLDRRALAALYGDDCPLAQPREGREGPDAADWVAWARALWGRHRSGVQPALRTAALLRHFRAGRQWVSWRAGDWREPPAPRDEARVVHNMMRPALALRQQVVSEQRPGFRTNPTKQSPEAAKKAEAQQRALEYQYGQQGLDGIINEAAYWAGTDGVSFPCEYWDPERGPWDEIEPGRRERLGELTARVYRIEQVRVSANATATVRPDYWVVRSTLPLAEAVARYGSAVLADDRGGPGTTIGASTGAVGDTALSGMAWTASAAANWDGRGGTSPAQLYADQETVEQFLVFCEPLSLLPDGLFLHVVGDAVVGVGELPWGVVPVVRFTDGSEDPAFYPTPLAADWIDHQRRVNALVSKVIENIRVNAHGRLLTRPGALKTETLLGGVLSVLEVNHGVSMDEAVRPLPPFSIAADVAEQIKFEVGAFEQKSGWNDATRGSFDQGESGRSILAQRETVERIFTPPVTAASKAMVALAEVMLHGMRWGYDLPRFLGATGGDRPDLARAISAEDFDGICDVQIDPETLMPMPRSMRLFLLDQMFTKQIITAQEYRERLGGQFAYIGSMQTPRTHKEARARRIAQAIQQGLPLPDPRWTDDEGIVQSILEEEILDVDKPDDPAWSQKVQQATQVWLYYARQSGQKNGTAPAPGGPGDLGGAPGGAPGGPGDVPGLPPTEQPFPSTNPGVAAAPANVMAGETDESHAQAADGMLGQ